MNKEGDLDPRVRPLVRELNKLGYETLSSCAGHKKNSVSEGYIAILGRPNKADLRNKLKTLGLHKAQLVHSTMFTTVEVTIIRFPGLGGSKGGRKLPKCDYHVSKEEEITLMRLFSRNLHRLGIHTQSKISVLSRYALSMALEGSEIKVEVK